MKYLVTLSIFISFSVQSQHLKEKDFEKCLKLKGYGYIDFTVFPGTPTNREISYGDDKGYLTIEEGYRIRYAYSNIKLIDLKVEYPQADEFLKEVEKQKKFFEYLQSKEASIANVHYHEDIFGYKGYTLDRLNTSKEFMFLSTNCLFDYENKRFIYVYYWNINREEMTFETIKDFLKQKEISLPKILKCLK